MNKKLFSKDIEKSQSNQHTEFQRINDLEQRLNGSFQDSGKSSEKLQPILEKFNEFILIFEQNQFQQLMKQIIDDLNTIKTSMKSKLEPLKQISKDVIISIIFNERIKSIH